MTEQEKSLVAAAEAAALRLAAKEMPEDACAPECVQQTKNILLSRAASGESALSKVIQSARLEMRDRCAIEAYKAYKAGNGDVQRAAAAASNNIRALPLESGVPITDQHLRIKYAFDLIAAGNSVTILSLGEMEAIVRRALNGEFDAALRASVEKP